MYKKTLFLLVAFAVVILLTIHYWAEVLSMRFPYFDDAYMYIRYANNILKGYGYSWNPDGHATYGCTDIVFTFMVALLRRCFPYLSDERTLLLCSSVSGYFAGLF